MKARLNPNECYMAGLTRIEGERNAVQIETSMDEVEERFVKLALKEFKIEPNRILIEEEAGLRRIYFYHSQVARELGRIRAREDKIFKAPNDLSKSYVAGIIDSSGRISNSGISIRGLKPIDEVMLANLGIHTRNGRIMNISTLLSFVSGLSLFTKQYSPGK